MWVGGQILAATYRTEILFIFSASTIFYSQTRWTRAKFIPLIGNATLFAYEMEMMNAVPWISHHFSTYLRLLPPSSPFSLSNTVPITFVFLRDECNGRIFEV